MQHKASTDIHLGAYVQAADPGAVGANILWVDTSTAAPYQLKKRNTGNTGWDLVGGTAANPMTIQGDMIYGGAAGASTRLPTAAAGLTLKQVQNAAAIADPNSAPTGLVQGTGASTFSGSTTYFVAYSWGNALGESLVSPTASFTTPATNPQIETGTIPAAPAGTTVARIYVGLSATTLLLNSTINNPSTSATTNFTISGPSGGGAASPVTINTTGGVTPTWSSATLSSLSDVAVTGPINNQGLIYNSTTGKWTNQAQSGSGGGGSSGGTGGSIVPILTQNPSGVNLIRWTVPTGFKNLRLTGDGRSDAAAANTVALNLTLNGDSGPNYDSQVNQSGGAGTAAGGTSIQVGRVSGAAAAVSSTGGLEVLIPDHASTTYFKSVISHSQVRVGAANIGSDETGGQWLNTSPVTTVTLTLSAGNFVAGSSYTLWGESDTAPLLLTSNSNLIQETVVPASGQATIPIPNLPQGYRDLRIEIENARVSDAVASTRMLLQINGDTASANYQTQELYGLGGAAGATSFTTLAGLTPGNVSGTSIADPAPSGASVLLQDYTGTSRKTLLSLTGGFDSGPNSSVVIKWGRWTSTAAITSLVLAHTGTGTFQVGTTVRVYGEPASSAGPSVGTGTRLRVSANQALTSGVALSVPWDTEDNDADNQHYTLNTALTGTVAKTAASNALVGTGTLFTTELSIGQVISVPGTATEVAVVTSITDATHLTVATNFANTATAQTATRVNSAIVFRQPGFFEVEVGQYLAAVASGNVTIQIRLNGSTIIGQADKAGVNASAGYDLVINRNFQQWDYIETLLTQTSGAAVNLLADERTHVAVSARPTVIVSVPYICIQDQKAQNTSGGTATAGAWQTRDLNTIVSDRAGVVSTLASNQFTLPPGTYQIRASSPAVNVSRHQTRLQNITDAVTTLTGTSEVSSNAASESTRSHISGDFRIYANKTFAIQHQVQTTTATTGFGYEANFGPEIYTIVELWKVG